MSLLLFVPFSVIVMGAPVKLDYIWASLCLLGAAISVQDRLEPVSKRMSAAHARFA
jgi:hypothetical protein